MSNGKGLDLTIAFVIARERSDCGNLSRIGEIATLALLPRNDTRHYVISLRVTASSTRCSGSEHRTRNPKPEIAVQLSIADARDIRRIF